MKKHQDYLNNGGHFIVPLPGVEVGGSNLIPLLKEKI